MITPGEVPSNIVSHVSRVFPRLGTRLSLPLSFKPLKTFQTPVFLIYLSLTACRQLHVKTETYCIYSLSGEGTFVLKGRLQRKVLSLNGWWEKFASGKFIPWPSLSLSGNEGRERDVWERGSLPTQTSKKRCREEIACLTPAGSQICRNFEDSFPGSSLYFKVDRGPWGRGWTT